MTPNTLPPAARQQDRRIRAGIAILFVVPALVLAASYAWLAVDHGTLALWDVTVHESGRYTLGETVLYFSHFLREVPTAIAYALFLLGISAGAGLPRSGAGAARSRPAVATLAFLGAAALVAVAFGATVRADGADSALRDLLQYRTRDELLEYGSHWRFHLLSTIWFGAATALAVPVARWWFGTPVLRFSRAWTVAAWGYVLTLTLVFGVSADIFMDGRYVGHQAREIMTHGPVTLLLGLGLLLAMAARQAAPEPPGFLERRSVQACFAAAFLLVPLYLAVVALTGDAMAHGQTDLGLGAMVGAHYFEHTLDYLLVLLMLIGGLALSPQPAGSSCHE
jgi:hypothetical protein